MSSSETFPRRFYSIRMTSPLLPTPLFPIPSSTLQAASVRLVATTSLTSLYLNPDSLSLMSAFTQRFLPRMRQLVDDVDTHVAVAAVDLLAALMR